MSFQNHMIFFHTSLEWDFYCPRLLKSCYSFVWGIERNGICMLMQSQSYIRWSITNSTGTASTWDSGWKEAQWSQWRSLRRRPAQVESCMLIWPYWRTVLCHPVWISVIFLCAFLLTGDISSISGSDSDSEDDDEVGPEETDSALDTDQSTRRLSTKAVFQNMQGQYLSLYRCVLQNKKVSESIHHFSDLLFCA